MTQPPWARRRDSLVGSEIDASISLLQRRPRDTVRFSIGSPSAESIPTEIMRDLANKVIQTNGPELFDYAATEGSPELRAALLEFLSGTEERTTDDRLLITSGGMQGLDLAGKLFVDPGDVVVVEAPTYTNGTATMLSYGAHIVEAPVDGDGLVVDRLPDLARQAGRPPKAIYVIPSFQNPAGTTLSLARRKRLLELAHRWNCVIIDDDPYGWLRFGGSHVPSMRALSGGDPLVVSVRTFSKILAPGLRLGWVDADPRTIRAMIAAKQAMDTCTNLPAQRIAAEFVSGGFLGAHLRRLRVEYRARKLAMQSALSEHLAGVADWTDPDGGFFLWLTLPGVDTSELAEAALAEGVAFIPGRAFSLSGAFRNALRLCFAGTDPQRTALGVRRLTRAVRLVREHARGAS
ncbi:PLP-dependent aminotransferase family protein [Pseudonocardia acaciae]|uniref:aminotransferase-like domain-containing protein n=1 Tax=Pseudonocardia acaciae TaxID=551276 RepID=UPI00048AD29B|nr:PLP-dependent aminotransferase family protein [Pseudonocardia acaciae]